MIEEKYVDLYARNSGMKDKLVAERDVVLTYALRALLDAGLMNHLAFKGGTCLRKMIFGSSGRFSDDLDFTFASEAPRDDVLLDLVETFNQKHHGITYTLQDYYVTEEESSLGGDVLYQHSWNSAGRFRLQVSLRERPTLPVTPMPMEPQGYFKNLEIEAPIIPSLATVEMIAEKVRAAFQRAKVRDLYDLHRFSTRLFDGELLRPLAVLKLWQAKDPFEPESFFKRLRSARYDWNDLRRLLRSSDLVDPEEMLVSVETRFAFLNVLSDLETPLIDDARKSGRNQPLADKLRAEILRVDGSK
jgi:predicted nucleotidyltransferase component of viral defense system